VFSRSRVADQVHDPADDCAATTPLARRNTAVASPTRVHLTRIYRVNESMLK
jgi:hypothetical protein